MRLYARLSSRRLQMNHPARKTGGINPEQAQSDQDVTLKVIDKSTLPHWSRAQPEASTRQGHCLLYLVPLQSARDRSSQARRLRLKDSLAGGDAGRNAVILARDPHFWDYLQQINLVAYEHEIDTRRARHFINRVCGINGRLELNRSSHCAERFFTLIERPFLEWLFAGDGG
jgi:hypothetical protein